MTVVSQCCYESAEIGNSNLRKADYRRVCDAVGLRQRLQSLAVCPALVDFGLLMGCQARSPAELDACFDGSSPAFPGASPDQLAFKLREAAEHRQQ